MTDSSLQISSPSSTEYGVQCLSEESTIPAVFSSQVGLIVSTIMLIL